VNGLSADWVISFSKKEIAMLKKTILGAVIAVGALAGVAQAQVVVRVAPPAPVYEVTPAARPGYVWAPGHHEWRNNQYVWVPGTWYRDRPGYTFEEPRWVQRNGGWVLAGNDWRRGPHGDRDGDGIANRYDRDRDGDGIPNRFDNNRNRFGPNGDLDRDGVANRHDRDRDGDGIRNARDRHPDDRRRS
jgi:hypothetical protein